MSLWLGTKNRITLDASDLGNFIRSSEDDYVKNSFVWEYDIALFERKKDKAVTRQNAICIMDNLGDPLSGSEWKNPEGRPPLVISNPDGRRAPIIRDTLWVYIANTGGSVITKMVDQYDLGIFARKPVKMIRNSFLECMIENITEYRL